MQAQHARLWFDDRAYRLSWLILPQAAAIVAALFLLTSPPGGNWAQDAFSERNEALLTALRDKALAGDKTALSRLEESARAGDALASFKLATIYDPHIKFEQKREVQTDAKIALGYYEVPARLGFTKAYINLIELSMDESFGVYNPAKGCRALADFAAGNAAAFAKEIEFQVDLAVCYEGKYADKGFAADTERIVPLFEAAAAAKHGGALNKLGYIYQYGKYGKSKDLFKARTYYEQAEQFGSAASATNLWRFYAEGWGGVAKDPAKVRTLLEKSASDGNGTSNNILGYLYETGEHGFTVDPALAATYYRKGVELGNLDAMNNLGTLYNRGGGGLPKDYEQAAYFFAKSIENGNKFTIDLFLNRGSTFNAEQWKAMQLNLKQRGFDVPTDGVVNAATLEAIRRLGRGEAGAGASKPAPGAASLPPANEADLQTMMDKYGAEGLRNKAANDGDKIAFQALEKMAGKPDAAAQLYLGTLYDPEFENNFPLKVSYSDAAKAVKLYGMAAEAGSAAAMLNLGRLLSNESYPVYDFKRACGYLNQWWEKKTPEAEDKMRLVARLGDCFNSTIDKNHLTADPAKAGALYKIAADGGWSGAQYMLGMGYWHGRYGLAKDMNKARKYLELAAAQNHSQAIAGVGDLNALGLGGFPQDYAAARKVFEKCAKLKNPWCINRLGVYSEQGLGGFGKDPAAAMRYYEEAADLGSAASAHQLGVMLYSGNAAVAADHARAARFFVKALQGGDAQTLTLLTSSTENYDAAFWKALQAELKIKQSGARDTETLNAIQRASGVAGS